MRSRHAVATAIVIVAATFGCVRPSAIAADRVRLTIGVIGPIGSIDPAGATSAAAREALQLQYATLTTFSVDALEIVPGLAEAWTPALTGTGFVYTLRPTTWSDGRPITAADVVASLDRARIEHWPYANGALRDLRARALNERNVEVTSNRGLGALPALPLHVMPAGAAADVSSGDFRIGQHDERNVTMDVVDRPGRPALDQIVFRSYPDAPALEAALEGGDVDIAGDLPARDYDRVQEVGGATAIHANDGDQWVLDLRIDDPELRRAIALAIDRERLVRDAVNGVGRVATVPVFARAEEWRLDDDEVAALAVDPAPDRARELVAARPDTPDLTIATPEGRVARVISDGVIASLEEVGIGVQRVRSGAADIEVVRRDPSDDPTTALHAFTSAEELHCDPAFDAAFATFLTGDVATRYDAAHDMTRLVTADSTEIPLFMPDQLQAFRTDNVTGMLRQPEQIRLVTFWPSVAQYRDIVVASPPPSEELPATTFITLALGVAAIVAVVVALIDRRIHAER